MSRVNNILERLEAVARKIGMSIEDAVAILEGKHPTHSVVDHHGPEAFPAKPSVVPAPTSPNEAVVPSVVPQTATTGTSSNASATESSPGAEEQNTSEK